MKLKLLKIEFPLKYVATVTLSNPPVNAHSQEMLLEIAAAFDYLSDHSGVRAIVMTGEGKCFCAGADIKQRASKQKENGDHWQNSRRAREAYFSIMDCQKPVIGAINGAALGGGLALAASCDILVTAEEGCLGLPEINVGLLGGGRHAFRLFGHSRTRRMMLTGYRVGGPELLKLGIVEDCVTSTELMPVCLSMATEIASKSPLATKLAKHALNQIESLSIRDGYRFEQSMTGELLESDDSREAMAAFLEKRQPNFGVEE